eukprot:gene8626-34070_t
MNLDDDLDNLDFDVDAVVEKHEQHKQKQSGPLNIHHAQGLHKAHTGPALSSSTGGRWAKFTAQQHQSSIPSTHPTEATQQGAPSRPWPAQEHKAIFQLPINPPSKPSPSCGPTITGSPSRQAAHEPSFPKPVDALKPRDMNRDAPRCDGNEGQRQHCEEGVPHGNGNRWQQHGCVQEVPREACNLGNLETANPMETENGTRWKTNGNQVETETPMGTQNPMGGSTVVACTPGNLEAENSIETENGNPVETENLLGCSAVEDDCCVIPETPPDERSLGDADDVDGKDFVPASRDYMVRSDYGGAQQQQEHGQQHGNNICWKRKQQCLESEVQHSPPSNRSRGGGKSGRVSSPPRDLYPASPHQYKELQVSGDLNAPDLNARDLNAPDLHARGLNAHDLNAHDLNAPTHDLEADDEADPKESFQPTQEIDTANAVSPTPKALSVTIAPADVTQQHLIGPADDTKQHLKAPADITQQHFIGPADDTKPHLVAPASQQSPAAQACSASMAPADITKPHLLEQTSQHQPGGRAGRKPFLISTNLPARRKSSPPIRANASN